MRTWTDGVEAANLYDDHRQRVNVRHSGGSLFLARVGERIEELWRGPTNRTPRVRC